MGKKILFFCTFFVLCAALWAGGHREGNESRAAADPSGFTDTFDTSEKKPGKWNYYLEAKDKAGNVSLSGPENILIDPESDLPRTTIINPTQNMRVQGNLNIVGIAVDDDGVDFIALSIKKGRDDPYGEEMVYTRAEGADYWSYFVDTTDQDRWTDGEYTITAWATDITGLSGVSEKFKVKQHKKHVVHWHLDRKKPLTEVTSHDVGALVSGKINIRGTVSDGNGIFSLAYSLDGGKRYIPARTSLDKRTGNHLFNINLNTNTIEDGPHVIWFRSQDGQGSVGTAAHLLFVNNAGPDVQIVYPPADTVVNGVFTVAGYASHPVGLQSVTWKADRFVGELPLVIGNSWWSTDIDLRGSRSSNVEVEIRATDVSGNVTVRRQRYKIDQTADLPIVTLQQPAANAVAGENGEIVVIGSVADDDGAASVFYSLNAQAPVEIPCSGAFQFIIPGAAEGAHTVEVWAKDITGITGPRVQVRGITVPGALPEPRIANFTSGIGNNAAVNEFYTGMIFQWGPLGQRMRTNMFVNIKGSSVASATASFGNQPAVPIRPLIGKDGVFTGSVVVPDNLPEGVNTIELRAVDRFGREAVYEEYFFVNNADNYPFTWIRPKETADGKILLTGSDDTLLGLYREYQVVDVTLQGPGAENVYVQPYQTGVVLGAHREGSFGPFTININDVAQPQRFSVIADFSGPELTVHEAPEGKWVQTKVPLVLSVAGANRITSVEYSLDMGATWEPMLSESEAAQLARNPRIDRTIDITGAQDGSISILVRATNEAGRTSVKNFTVLKDTVAPEAELITPIADARVNGTIRMGFSVKEGGKLKSIKYKNPNPRFNDIEVFANYDRNKDYSLMFMDPLMDAIGMPLAENMIFVFEDEAGNTSQVDYWPFIIDTEMDIPTALISLPLDNEVITTDFLVSGVMYDDDAIRQIYWNIDDNQPQTIVAEYGFSVPIPLSSLTDNEHSITVVAEDIYGVRSAPVKRTFRVSLSEPSAAVTYPSVDTILRDVIEIKGTAFDRNGIDRLQVSVDNGNSFNIATGADEWSYRFNSRILKDGPHVVFVRVWDKYDIPATYASMINVDNTPPEIQIDSPHDGSTSTGWATVMGRTIDPNLGDVSIEFRSLEGIAVRQDLRSRKLESVQVVKEQLDLRNQPDGLYNIEVVAYDRAGNITRVSRNIKLARESMQNFVEILYPLDNEHTQGVFNLYGVTGGTDLAGTVTLRINGIDHVTTEVEESGYFRFSMDSEFLDNGSNIIVVHSDFGGEKTVQSRQHRVVYKADGPWVTIDSLNMGEFAFERPFLFGRTGYALSEEDQFYLHDKDTASEIKSVIRDKAPDYTEISFDNGKTFYKTGKSIVKGIDYRYRLETGDMAEGLHFILVRSTMRNGETAVTKILVQVDKTLPVIRLISPEPGAPYNTEIFYSASATDDVELVGLTYHLRKGDKASYEVPGFLQGLYFEGIIPPFIRVLANDAPFPFTGGATFTDFGFGLSFFDDNVKIQVQYGFMFQQQFDDMGFRDGRAAEGEDGKKPIAQVRYGGNVLGLKLLANVYSLPFGSIAGPDWEWLHASFALGANFSLFDIGSTTNKDDRYAKTDAEGNKTYPTYTQSGSPTWMSALLLQVEFPKVTLPKRKYLRTFSLFTEGQLWFVPTDVDAAALGIEVVIPHVIMGLRLYIF